MPDDDYERPGDRFMRKIEEKFDPSLLRRYQGGPHMHKCIFCESTKDCSKSCRILKELADGTCYGSDYICDGCKPKTRFGLLMRNQP